MSTRRRDPVQLARTDAYSCYAAVIAQVRWMFGSSDLTGLEAVRDVDRITGRAPGQPSYMQSELLLLAREGFQLRSFEIEVSAERVRREGAAYIRGLQNHAWTDTQDAYWTSGRLAEYADRLDAGKTRFREEFGPYVDSGQVHVTYRAGGVADLNDALVEGYVVIATTRHGGIVQTILVYGRDGDFFTVHVPNMTGEDTLLRWHRDYVEVVLLPENSIVAVKRAAK